MTKPIRPLNAASYRRHPIHTDERHWGETNCYTDVWIELLHAWGFDPVAVLGFTVAIDFEGDQWTFFKPPHGDLAELYGLGVLELAIWRPLISHVEEQVALGRPVLVELDSFHLPDTAGTAYQLAHVKSTVAVNEIDVAGRRLGYFHNQGYYELHGADFVNVFQLESPRDPTRLPPYVEFVKPRRQAKHGAELLDASVELFRRHLGAVPDDNPFRRFKARFETDLGWLGEEGLDTFHNYSFATLRQFGACYELTATYLDWLRKSDLSGMSAAAAAFTDLSAGAKTLQFQLARSVARKKQLDLTPLNVMAERWHGAVTNLKTEFRV